MTRLVLASQSASRLTILQSAGFDPEVIVSGVDEAITAEDTNAMVLELARRKARAVAEGCGPALVIGCDSLLDVDGNAYGKAPSIEVARERWQSMRNNTASLVTGHCLINTERALEASEVIVTQVTFGNPSDDELEAYLATNESLGGAGGFTLEGRSAAFIAGVVGDALNVMGLSPACIARLLARVDASLLDVWPVAPGLGRDR